MHINYLEVFERIKDKDILHGGKNNLAIKTEVEPYINHDDTNEDLSCKYLLVEYEFYILHALHCMDLMTASISDKEIIDQGYSEIEVSTARKFIEQYGDSFDKKEYLFIANMKMEMVAHTIGLILENKPLQSIPEEIIKSAKTRIAYADKALVKEYSFRS